MSLWLCVSFIHNIWIEWDENPVTTRDVTNSFNLINISTIPFSTVTICPEIKTWKQRFDISASLNYLPNLSDRKYEFSFETFNDI